MDVSKNRGTPKWMVKIMENPIKMNDLGVPLFLETPISIFLLKIWDSDSCYFIRLPDCKWKSEKTFEGPLGNGCLIVENSLRYFYVHRPYSAWFWPSIVNRCFSVLR